MSHKSDDYFRKVLDIKKYFLQHCPVNNLYEKKKIWAHWIITHQSLDKQEDSIIPTNGIRDDQQIITHMTEKGSQLEKAQQFYHSFCNRCEMFIEEIRKDPLEGIATVSNFFDEAEGYYVECSDICYHRIPFSRYNKLTKFCKQDENENQFRTRLCSILNYYYILGGNSLQWSVPLSFYQLLSDTFDFKGELFASPLNNVMESYYSLFPVDVEFGSKGNFFENALTDIQEGCYEANPPFIEPLFIESSLIINKCIQQANDNEKELLFIYIMPGWTDSNGYVNLLRSNNFIYEHVLPNYNHKYFDAKNQKYICVHFDTHVIVVGSEKSRKNISGKLDTFAKKINTCFKMV